VSSLPEITGDCGLLVDPLSIAEIRGGLTRLLTEASLREKLGAAGRERAKQFTWADCARRSLDFFRRVLG